MDVGAALNEDDPFYLPPAVAHVRKGSCLDIFPILSLMACFPTLRLFFVSRRRSDLFIYTVGLLVAILYHFLQVCKPGGLGTTSWLGLPGAGWRIIDILFADFMLARSAGHVLGIQHPVIASLPNVVLPASLLGMLILNPRGAGLQLFTICTGVCVLATIALQLLLDARAIVRHAVLHFNTGIVVRTIFFCVLGFSCFVVPAKYPAAYWFWHSAWHVCMGLAYFEVYAALCGIPASNGILRSKQVAKRKHWMEPNHFKGDTPPAKRATYREQTGIVEPEQQKNLKAAFVAGSYDYEEQQTPIGRGRRGGRRRSGPSSTATPPSNATTPTTAGRGQGRGRVRAGAVRGEAADTPATSPARQSPGRRRGASKGGKRSEAASAATDDEEVQVDMGTPPAPRRASKGVVGEDEGQGSIAQRVRTRRRRSGGGL